MRTSSFQYLIKEGARNIIQNRVLSFAAIGVLMACLLLVGASMLFTLNVNSLIGYVESQNEIMIYLDDDLRGDALTVLDEELHGMENISSATFISRDEGLRDWMETLGEDGALLEQLLEDNPLQNAYRLVIRDLSKMDETVLQLQEMNGIETVSASNEVAKAVTGLKQAVSTGGTAIIIILMAVSAVIVANTIRITVFNRRKEINIMKYVGATDGFIRLPFLSEGILLGAIAATLAFILLWAGYSWLGSWLGGSDLSWAGFLFGELVPFGSAAPKIYLTFLLAGIGVGGLGSAAFVGRYLKI